MSASPFVRDIVFQAALQALRDAATAAGESFDGELDLEQLATRIAEEALTGALASLAGGAGAHALACFGGPLPASVARIVVEATGAAARHVLREALRRRKAATG